MKINDRVRLKSGGPLMIVKEIYVNHILHGNRVLCEWIDKNGLQQSRFDKDALQLIEGIAS